MSSRLIADLTEAQREAVLHRDGPLLILAGAGSGKTRVVTRRIAHLIGTGVSPGAILAITFTNKAATEMRERVATLLPPGVEAPLVCTFHSFAVRVLREYGGRLGLDRRFSILDPTEQQALIREAAVSARVDVKRFPPPVLSHMIGRAKERLDDAGFIASAHTDEHRAAAKVLPLYRALQLERGALDFEDLVASTVTLMEEHPDVHDVLVDRYRYVSIDEYQDTNHSQYRLAALLAGERKNLTVCGDPDQSIYGWRGADMGNILRFEDEFPGAKVVLLEHNYRSTATILEAANALIRNNSERKEKQLRPTGDAGQKIDVAPSSDADMEADYVARRIKKMIETEGVSPREIAVIFRGKTHAPRYEDALLRRGIRATTVGSSSFFDRREIMDALSFVRLAVNPRDDMAALRALKLHTKGVGKRTIEKLHHLQRDRGLSLVESCEQAKAIGGLTQPCRNGLRGFARKVRSLEKAANGSIERLVASAISEAGLEEALVQRDEQADARLKNLRRLTKAAEAADRRAKGKATARDFLDHLSLLDSQDRDDDQTDAVILTTAHSAKGLEFEVVFVVGLEESLFPHWRSVEEGGVEEERRLAYVAMTRAKLKLVLCYASRRASRRPGSRMRIPSQFLYELPSDLLWDPQLREEMVLPDRKELEAAAKASQPNAPAKGKTEKPGKTDPTGKPKRSPLWARGLVVTRR